MIKQKSPDDWEAHYAKEDPYGAGGRWISEKKRIWNSFLVIPKDRNYNAAVDLCSGEGHFTSLLADLVESVVSVEISRNAIQRAQKRLQGKPVLFRQADAFEIDFPNNSFDLVCAIECLEYAQNKPKEVSKWARWLQPGGLLVATGPILPGYFTWDEFVQYFERDFKVVDLRPVTTKFILAKLANRHLLAFPERIYDLSMALTRILPKPLTKHLALVAEPRKN
jgi:SAM-dependent methyltransferase